MMQSPTSTSVAVLAAASRFAPSGTPPRWSTRRGRRGKKPRSGRDTHPAGKRAGTSSGPFRRSTRPVAFRATARRRRFLTARSPRRILCHRRFTVTTHVASPSRSALPPHANEAVALSRRYARRHATPSSLLDHSVRSDGSAIRLNKSSKGTAHHGSRLRAPSP